MVADVRALPFRSGAFDAVVTASPWNVPRIVDVAMPEMTRVCKRGGRIVIMLRKCTEVRDHLGRIVRRVAPLPQSRPGPRYWSTPPEGAAQLVRPGELVLDPFCGIGGIVKGAQLGGAIGVGSDIDEEAVGANLCRAH